MTDNTIVVGSSEVLRQERYRPSSRLILASDQREFTEFWSYVVANGLLTLGVPKPCGNDPGSLVEP